jgi:hypothetical protein
MTRCVSPEHESCRVDVMDNNDDRINTRDLADLIIELQDDEDAADELAALVRFTNDCIDAFGEHETNDGVTLISDSEFEEYARELADDLGVSCSSDEWPTRHIDWAMAAKELQSDYTAVEWDGVIYWGLV